MPRESNAKAKANANFHVFTLKTLPSTPSFEGCSSECLHKGSCWLVVLGTAVHPAALRTHSSPPVQLKEHSCPTYLGMGPPQLCFNSPQMVFFGYMVFSIVLGLLADRYGRWKVSDCWEHLVLFLAPQESPAWLSLCLNDPNSCPFADPAALLPLGSLFLPADLICPILHLVCVPAGHGRRWRVRPRSRVRMCKPPSQGRQWRGWKGKGGQIPTLP